MIERTFVFCLHNLQWVPHCRSFISRQSYEIAFYSGSTIRCVIARWVFLWFNYPYKKNEKIWNYPTVWRLYHRKLTVFWCFFSDIFGWISLKKSFFEKSWTLQQWVRLTLFASDNSRFSHIVTKIQFITQSVINFFPWIVVPICDGQDAWRGV